jgi:hypothetical protein
MSFVTDALPGITVGAGFPALSTKIVELATPAFALRPLLQTVPFPAGRTFVFYKQVGSRTIGVSRGAEDSVAIVDFTTYTAVSYEPPIYKAAVWISKGVIDSFQPVLNIVQDQLNRLARRVVNQIETDVEAAFNTGASSTVTATGTSLGFNGTEFTISGSIGTKDIIEASKRIMQKSLMPEYLIVNPAQYAQIKYLPHYSAYMYTGEESPGMRRGVVGEVENLRVVVSPIVPAGTAYVVSTGTNPSGAYEPLGYWVEKSPFSAWYRFDMDDHMHKVSTYYHAGPLVTSSDCIVKIQI